MYIHAYTRLIDSWIYLTGGDDEMAGLIRHERVSGIKYRIKRFIHSVVESLIIE